MLVLFKLFAYYRKLIPKNPPKTKSQNVLYLHCTVKYCIYYIALHCIALFGNVQCILPYSILMHCVVLFSVVLHFVVLECISLQ